MRIIDITLPLSDQTPVWEGDNGIVIKQVASISKNSDFNVSCVKFGVHSGTHIDAPFHVFNDGNTNEKISLDPLIGPVKVLRIDDSVNVITREVLLASGFRKGIKRLLLKTKNTEYWLKKPWRFNREYAAVDSSAAKLLVDEGISFVGIDYFSISPFNDLKAPHEILLRAGIVILENAYLEDVEPGFYNLICLPLNLVGTDGAPVRAVLTTE
jgi:arylformamidase